MKISTTSSPLSRPRNIDSKSLVNELKTKLDKDNNHNNLDLISNVLKKKNLIKKFIITKTSLSPEQAKYCGISLTELVDKLISKAKFEKV